MQTRTYKVVQVKSQLDGSNDGNGGMNNGRTENEKQPSVKIVAGVGESGDGNGFREDRGVR